MTFDPCNAYNPYITPDPHFIPGYTGYCPRRKYQLGKTFGHETHEALASSRKVPTTIPRMDPSDPCGDVDIDPMYLIRNRLPTEGDVKLREDMWPGYTGYIPTSIRSLGKTYGRSCREAIATFEQEQRRSRQVAEGELPEKVDQGGGSVNPAVEYCWQPEVGAKTKVRGPLKRIALDPEWPRPPDYNVYSESPYNMGNRDPRKYFIPGYMGYVPGLRFATGVTYGLATNHGLCRFTQGLDERRATATRPVIHDWHHPDAKEQTNRPHLVLPNHALPFMDTGCLPKYTGYVPGLKYSFGESYGKATQKLLKLSEVTGVTDVSCN